ncbi:glycosyltransferase family 2 protein [Oceaniglobus trochenteri]|uniref:glycosyltransferase family 2 protein n=1 Tax=Oceaniglobus trochenteri TaxID=2763260 RepID=UPI001CFFE979|nr:glycosyltransferase family A protein [Oceaniglobus trochenteri]
MTMKVFLSRLARLIGSRGAPGYIDHFDSLRVAGWAHDPNEPDQPALLSLYVDGKPEMNIVADIPREDVSAAGFGPLHCGFDTTLPKRLRDGRAHRLELRLGADGPILRGGTLDVPASSGQHPLADETEADAVPAEGVAFLEAGSETISGWALGCTGVSVVFDDQTPREIALRHEVPGFGSGLRPGFRLAIPEDLKDGAQHRAQVFFSGTLTPLDGSPVDFRLVPGRPFVDIVSLKGHRLALRLRDLKGRPVAQDFELLADGKILQGEARRDTIAFDLPPGAGSIVVRDLAGTTLARLALTGGGLAPAPLRELPPGSLSDESCAAATEAFSAFCAAPDARFDPLWYRWSHPGATALEDPEALIAHYRDVGAPGGIGPGPFFDETTARQTYPELAEAIAQGRLPCAFALSLVLRPGQIETLAGLSPDTARQLQHTGPQDTIAPAEEPLPPLPPTFTATRLPLPTQAQNPASAIYAAWVSRLELPDATRAELAQDEQLMRREIRSVGLERAPLVSIVMPSWNRAFTIGEAIQSVLEQTYENWELIVCDDASDDRTSEVVRGFDDPRIRYMKFLKSNGAGARNKGLARARGEYIAYLDSDNIWHPLFLSMMIRRLMGNPGCCIAYSTFLDTEITGARVRLLDIPRSHFRPIPLSSKNFMDLNSIVHHRRVYDWMGGFDNDLPRLQDWDLSLRYTSVFRPVFVNHVGVFYRRNVAWGQVTHLFMGAGTQNTVNEKTRKRLEEGHERLKIDWPRRGRIAILCNDPERRQTTAAPDTRHRMLAENLARMAARLVDVDLIVLGVDAETADAGPRVEGLTRHGVPAALQRDPARLGKALGGMLRGCPVLGVGLSAQYLRSIHGLEPRLVYRLRGSGEGNVLQALDTPTFRFHMGAVPVDLPEGPHANADMTVLTILPQQAGRPARAKLREQLVTEAQRRGLTLLVPPMDELGWTQIDRSGVHALEVDPQHHLPAAIGRVAMAVNLTPVSELDPFGLSLLNALQGRGVPCAVLPDEGRARATGFARQWIDARAAYEIKVNDPKWIFDKVRKLLGDANGMQRLSERSLTVHRIACHPELAQERLAHALYRLLHDIPQEELIHGTP